MCCSFLVPLRWILWYLFCFFHGTIRFTSMSIDKVNACERERREMHGDVEKRCGRDEGKKKKEIKKIKKCCILIG